MPSADTTAHEAARGQSARSVAVVMAIVVAYLALSMLAPRYVPRLGFLPRPANRVWDDGCNTHAYGWERRGPFWQRGPETQTMVGCGGPIAPRPANDGSESGQSARRVAARWAKAANVSVGL